MGSLISYSGISTKVRAMERWRLSEDQFKELAAQERVSEAVRYLKGFAPYREIFEGIDDKDLHRAVIEQRLELSVYREFARLYQFANVKQRHFLDLYFMHYEIDILKTCLRNAVGHREERRDLSLFKEFFQRHASIDLIRLSEAGSLQEFIDGLKGSPYYEPLHSLLQKGHESMPACENALDMLYFKAIWRAKDKFLSKEEGKIIAQCFGTRMDMLNIQWICRSRKYYRLSPGEIIAMIIPISLHLTKKEIREMAEAESVDQVLALAGRSWYGKLEGIKDLDKERRVNLDQVTREIIDRIYLKTSRRDPYSIAVLNSCLYFKERETQRIIHIIEKIRYGVREN